MGRRKVLSRLLQYLMNVRLGFARAVAVVMGDNTITINKMQIRAASAAERQEKALHGIDRIYYF